MCGLLLKADDAKRNVISGRATALADDLAATKTVARDAPLSGGGDAGAVPRRSRRIYARKSDIVLLAAERVFLRAGFAATSMDEIADEAGVSKRTVYSNFGSKEQLFADVIRKRCSAVVPDLKTFSTAMQRSPEEGLTLLAIAFLKGIFDKSQIQLYQTVVAAVRRHPDVGRIMYDGPITQSQQMFADYLRAQIELGQLTIGDAEEAAAQLIALLKTNLHMKLLFGRSDQVGTEPIAASAASSVRLFLYGALPR